MFNAEEDDWMPTDDGEETPVAVSAPSGDIEKTSFDDDEDDAAEAASSAEAPTSDDTDTSRVRSVTIDDEPKEEKKEEQKAGSIQTTVTDPEKVGDGQRAYYTYNVTVASKRANMDSGSVKRRYSDFEWLQKQLNIECPRFIIPRIPSKNRAQVVRGVDDEFLEKRRFLLAIFLKRICEHEKMSQATCVHHFLTLSAVDFEYQKKNSEKKSLVATLQNKVNNLRLSNPDETYQQMRLRMTDLIRELTALEKNLAAQRQNTIEVATDLNETGPILCEIGKVEPHFNAALTAMDQACTALVQEFVDKTGNENCSVIERVHELSQYADACVSLLTRRDLIEYNYEKTTESLTKKETELSTAESNPAEKFKSFFNKTDPNELKRQKIDEIKSDLDAAKIANEEAQTDLKLWNKTVTEELERFEAIRKRDLTFVLQRYVSIAIRHHTRSKQALDKLWPKMQKL